jgi:hypothetical protein
MKLRNLYKTHDRSRIFLIAWIIKETAKLRYFVFTVKIQLSFIQKRNNDSLLKCESLHISNKIKYSFVFECCDWTKIWYRLTRISVYYMIVGLKNPWLVFLSCTFNIIHINLDNLVLEVHDIIDYIEVA